MSKKVLFIGLDGATFDVLDPLISQGLMPKLKHFIDQGVRGPLETTIPPITPTAWVSWMTGKNPGKHGVFEFLLRRADTTQQGDAIRRLGKRGQIHDWLRWNELTVGARPTGAC